MAINKRLINTGGEVAIPTSFNTVLYTGTSGIESVTGFGFDPDFVWIKNRSAAASHVIFDRVRGDDFSIYPDLTNAQDLQPSAAQQFITDGFSVSGNWIVTDRTGDDYVMWGFKAGGAAVTNTDGDNDSEVSANVDAGFSVVKTLSNNTNQTYGHGLDSAPEMIISKNMGANGPWGVYHSALGTGKWLYLNQTNAVGSNVNVYPTVNSLAFSAGSQGWNYLTSNYIHYCFHSVAGFSKFGSYSGTGVASGNIVSTSVGGDVGFEPAFVLIKRSSSFSAWSIFDNKRASGSTANLVLAPDLSDAERSYGPIEFLSNGFELTNTKGGLNSSGETYIYMAFANQF